MRTHSIVMLVPAAFAVGCAARTGSEVAHDERDVAEVAEAVERAEPLPAEAQEGTPSVTGLDRSSWPKIVGESVTTRWCRLL